jgi:hypothetical protein
MCPLHIGKLQCTDSLALLNDNIVGDSYSEMLFSGHPQSAGADVSNRYAAWGAAAMVVTISMGWTSRRCLAPGVVAMVGTISMRWYWQEVFGTRGSRNGAHNWHGMAPAGGVQHQG